MSIALSLEITLKSENNQNVFHYFQSDCTEWLTVSKAIGKSCLLPINAWREASFIFLIRDPHCRMMHTEKLYLRETLIPVIHYGSEGSKASFSSVPPCVNMDSLHLKSVLLLPRRTAEVQSAHTSPLSEGQLEYEAVMAGCSSAAQKAYVI